MPWISPSAWPWFVYVWLVLTAAGLIRPLWRWVKRIRASGWPSAQGRIESVGANQPKEFLLFTPSKVSSATHFAELRYSYSVGGNVYAGQYKREFPTEREAWEFLRDLEGKPVTVLYNPNKPSSSSLAESSIETLLQTRAPQPAAEMFLSTSANSIPPWLRRFLWVFIVLSAVGLVVSLWVHLGAVMGRRVAPEALFWILHVGIFAVWFPAVFVAKLRVGNLRRKDFWKVVLQGSPEWMRYMVYGFLGYALVNFALFMLKAPTGGSGANPPAIVWRGFSGHWMAFYSAALAILYSAASGNENVRCCVSGHPVPPNANFCSHCGQPVRHA